MKPPALPWDAGCRCGAVRFRITAPAMMTMACHCTGCQKMTGGAYSTSIMVPGDALEIVAGETVRGGLGGRSGGGMAHHQHCDACKNWLFTRFEPDPGFVNIRATMLDDARWFTPYAETFTSEALPGVSTGAVVRFEQFPEAEALPGLLTAFAAQACAG